jgi:hypothetical protein
MMEVLPNIEVASSKFCGEGRLSPHFFGAKNAAPGQKKIGPGTPNFYLPRVISGVCFR